MSDNYDYDFNQKSENCFKEPVCIDSQRIYDSCSDKECIRDVRVYFCPKEQELIDAACNVKIRNVEVLFACLDLEPVAFNKGFYSVDITFFFAVCVDIFGAPMNKIASITGLSVINKNVVLYGSEGDVKVFSSDFDIDDFATQGMPQKNLPKATLQVAQPIGLDAKICKTKPCCEPCCRIPEYISGRFGGDFCISNCQKSVYITLGLFYIVQLQRNVQLLIPACDFCIPHKDCTCSDSPCELFSKIDFPTDEFFPPNKNPDGKISCKPCTCIGDKEKHNNY